MPVLAYMTIAGNDSNRCDSNTGKLYPGIGGLITLTKYEDMQMEIVLGYEIGPEKTRPYAERKQSQRYDERRLTVKYVYWVLWIGTDYKNVWSICIHSKLNQASISGTIAWSVMSGDNFI